MPQDKPCAEFPRYVSHKEVWALKLKTVQANEEGALLFPEDALASVYAPIQVDMDYVMKHRPQAGGYYVVYKDGYKSWSPAAAFESGYTPVS